MNLLGAILQLKNKVSMKETPSTEAGVTEQIIT